MIIENWAIIGLIGAGIVAVFNIYQKYIIEKGYEPLEIALQMHLVGSIVMAVVISFLEYGEDVGNSYSADIYGSISVYLPGIPETGLLALIVATGVVNALSFWLLASAYSDGALSVIAPLRGVTPIIVAFIEPLFFSSVGYEFTLIISSIIVAIGVYVVLYEDNVYEPIKRISDIGVMKGILSAAIIAMAVLIDRYSMVNYEITPVGYTGALIISTLVFTFAITLILKGKEALHKVELNSETAVLGIIRTSSVVFAITALSLVEGTRVNVVWQMSVVLAAVFGGSLLSEENLIRRGVGASLIIVAAAIVVAL